MIDVRMSNMSLETTNYRKTQRILLFKCSISDFQLEMDGKQHNFALYKTLCWCSVFHHQKRKKEKMQPNKILVN